ncbi:SEC-C metal-binding domain-containing protein [Clostridium sp.]|uniref:YecA family protein n=1 Tax=Clostridium sp. TaxID=1506 RepID=UPI0026398678|nr:SEC-C metal-binding domain-containing protein [Clostridium sp.]
MIELQKETKDEKEVQEGIIIKDIKKVEKIWKNHENGESLDYHLDRMTKEELLKIGNNYGVRGLTSLKKADLELRIKETIISKYEYILEFLDEDAYIYLKDVIDKDGNEDYKGSDLINANYFRDRGIMFTGVDKGKLKVVMPKEILNILKDKLDIKLEENSKMNSEIIDLTAGLIYFYGVCRIKDVITILKEEYEFKLDENRIEKLFRLGQEVGYDYQVDRNIIYHIDVDDSEDILEVIDKNKELRYEKFTRKTLIKASQPDYIEGNKERIKLEKALNQLFVIDKKILREELEGFEIAIKNEVSKQEAIDVFLEAYEIENEEEKNILKYELEMVYKEIRKWSLKGHKISEIEGKEKIIINEAKVGRNDLCPCGSKKKYKKCCGR